MENRRGLRKKEEEDNAKPEKGSKLPPFLPSSIGFYPLSNMKPNIPKWKAWPKRHQMAPFTLHLFVHELSGLTVDGLRWSPAGELAVQVEWRGNRRKAEMLLRKPRISSTSRRPPQPNRGLVSWEEGLSHYPCRLYTSQDSHPPNPWLINLEIQGYGFRSSTLGKTQIDAATHAHSGGKSMRVPLRCDINGSISTGALTVTVELTNTKEKEEKPSWRVFEALSHSFRKRRDSKESAPGSSDEATTMTNGTLFSSSLSSNPTTNDTSEEESAGGGKEEGRTNSLRVLMGKGTAAENRVEEVVLADGEYDGVGRWESRVVVSRDGRMEMTTEVFLASIDQCSEKAAGEGACAVLAIHLSDWLHRNKGTLPLRQEFDDMIRKGSLDWRILCRRSVHPSQFSNWHFDLETVLSTKVRPLTLDTSLSYVGFFSLDDTSAGDHDQTMSFDSIFDALLLAVAGDVEDRIYIASWNDHFFVLKMARDAIYLIDTLGERLQEGCNRAYIIKFGKGSVIKRRRTSVPAEEEAVVMPFAGEDIYSNYGEKENGGEGEVVVCQGMETCREYMKGFLAAVPLGEMRSEIERGIVLSHAEVHRRLQIEFHFTVPLPESKSEITEVHEY